MQENTIARRGESVRLIDTSETFDDGSNGISRGHPSAGSRSTDNRLPAAFSRLYEAEYDSQVRRAYLITGSSSAASDIVSEAFLSVYTRWESIDEPVLYMNRCVVNGCRDWGRRQNRWAKLIQPNTAPQSGSSLNEPRTDLGITIDGGFGNVELFDALSKLPHRQRTAIVLRYYGRETERSIADVLDCRPGTVGSLIHRGLARLRKELI